MVDITKEILKNLPEKSISDVAFEGANIVLYTKDKDFFLDNNGLIKRIVDDIKKRVELRPDPSITMDLTLPYKCNLDISKAEHLIGYKPKYSSQEVRSMLKGSTDLLVRIRKQG